MSIVIGVLAPGAMGSAIAAGLVEHGARVLTSLDGRSAATVARAQAAGMVDASTDEIARADLVLSIVPPGDAMALAERLAPHLTVSSRKPVYVDCNAVSPTTKQQIAASIAPTGCDFVDGGIIGFPPVPGGKGPALYVSGDPHRRTAGLAELGIDWRWMDAPIGAAAALKMSYGGIGKGSIALGAAMILAASRAGATAALHGELGKSQPQVLTRYQRAIPDMYAKAYRWVAEMREIAAFLGEDEAAAMMFEGAARLYERLAADVAGDGRERALLDAFFKVE
ncbi:MAG TPA: DUF1932 domain-containing protein [Stellaceae bacterium]|nr:DUF1932 domain-containing protein [Stellaceae bacterium]